MHETQTRVALYLNQFFGQIGGEEAAGAEPRLVKDAIGPGRALVGLLEPGEVLAGTVVCGDNYFADRPDPAAATCLALLRDLRADVLLAGPAFNAGRYGVACGALCRKASAELGIATVTGMYEENPGADMYRRDVVVIRTGTNAATMRETLAKMLRAVRKLHRGERLGTPAEDGYIPRGQLLPGLADRPAGVRAVDLLLAKLKGQPYQTEVPLPVFDPPPAPARLELRDKVVALVTDGGLVPAGNPDGIEAAAATKFAAYSIVGQDRLDAADYDVSHGGYDNRYVEADPNRLVPLDAARQLEREGRIGRLYDSFLSTSGMVNPVGNSRRLGRGMAEHLKAAGVDAVILTST
ncbi:MAG: glycine/betaine/sarcosine/D-proline family reductase selenoprotein B [Chloroflexota bacterium]|nr:glycine/betaine/sarcosine/D-proline family reductase selenoprotein B [Chloroflexota bacterium]